MMVRSPSRRSVVDCSIEVSGRGWTGSNSARSDSTTASSRSDARSPGTGAGSRFGMMIRTPTLWLDDAAWTHDTCPMRSPTSMLPTQICRCRMTQKASPFAGEASSLWQPSRPVSRTGSVALRPRLTAPATVLGGSTNDFVVEVCVSQRSPRTQVVIRSISCRATIREGHSKSTWHFSRLAKCLALWLLCEVAGTFGS